jgi:hypothetical protein
MEQVTKERIGEKEVHGTGKKPYISPTLKVYGDVEAITKTLRLAGIKSDVGSNDAFIQSRP